jgi:hypothetical protein
MHWWSIAWFTALALALVLLGRPEQAIAMGCFAAGFVVLGVRDRLDLMPANRARDRRALLAFAGFMAVLLAVTLVADVIKAL